MGRRSPERCSHLMGYLEDIRAKDAAARPAPAPREPSQPRTAANGTNVDAYVTKVLDGVAGAAYGTRNDTLNKAAHTLGRLVAAGQLDYGMTAELLQRTGEAAGLDAREIPGTIRSGLSSGEKKPRTLCLLYTSPSPRD